MNIDPQPEFADVKFLVEANGNEHHQLWREWATRLRLPERGEISPMHDTLEWEQISQGFWISLGQYEVVGHGKFPLCVSFHFARLNGIKVAFYEPTSAFFLHSEVKSYLTHHFGHLRHDGGRWSHVNAMNFHNCAQPILRNPTQFK